MSGLNKEILQDALTWNTDGIQSDRPAQLIALLERRKR